MLYEQVVALLDDSKNAVQPPLGKFEGNEDVRIAVALHEMWLDDSHIDERNDAPDAWADARIGRFLVREDDQGFFTYEAYESEEDASNALWGGEAANSLG